MATRVGARIKRLSLGDLIGVTKRNSKSDTSSKNENKNALRKALAKRFMQDTGTAPDQWRQDIQNSKIRELTSQEKPNVIQKTLKAHIKKQVDEAVFQHNNKPFFYQKTTLGLFGEESKLRKRLLDLVMSQFYNSVYIGFVLIHSVFLAFEKQIQNQEVLKGFHFLLFGITLYFLLDSLFKIIVQGLYDHKNAYLRDPFNIFDIFIVILGIRDTIHFLLVLRPMSLIQSNTKAKRYSFTLFKALPSLASVSFFLLFVFLLFSILGVYLFTDGYYGRCRITQKPVNATFWPMQERSDWCGSGFKSCPNDTYCGQGAEYGIDLEADNLQNDAGINYNLATFNNVGIALFSVFQIITLDSWTVHMYGLMKSTSFTISGLFFCTLVVLGNFFLLNLVLAVIIASFTELNKKSSHSQEEMMMLLKFAVARFFQKKTPKRDSFTEHKEVSKNVVKIKPNRMESQAINPFGISSNRSSQNLLPIPNSHRGMSIMKPNLPSKIPINLKEIEVSDDEESSNQHQSFDQFFQKPSHGLSKNSITQNNQLNPGGLMQSIIQAQGSQGSQQMAQHDLSAELDSEKDQKEKPLEEIKEEEKRSNFTFSDSDSDYDKEEKAANIGQQILKRVTSALSKSKDSSRSHVHQSSKDLRSLDVTSIGKASRRRIGLNQVELQKQFLDRKATFDKLLNDFKKKQSLAEKMESIKEKQWISTMKIRAKKNKKFNFFFKIAMFKYFNFFIQMAILANTIVMSLDRFPISDQESQRLEMCNMVFSIIFLIEMVIKLIGMGYECYFFDIYNKLDSVIVLLSIVDMAFVFVPHIDPKVLLPVRAFRLLRIFKLAKSWKRFRKLLSTIGKILSDIGPFSILILVFIYIFSLIGMNLFYQRVMLDSEGLPNREEGSYPDSNFNNVFDAFLCVFIVLVNDGWSTIFFQHAKGTQQYIASYAYFVFLLLFGQLIILNLFLSILLENFESDSQENAKDYSSEEVDKVQEHKEKQKKLQDRIESQMAEKDRDKLRMERFRQKFQSKKQVKMDTESVSKQFIFGNSLFCYTQESPMRKFLHKVIHHWLFDQIVVSVIVVSILALIFENPLLDPESWLAKVLDKLAIFFAIFFSIEAALKIVALGFAFNGYFSYLRNYRNLLDFIIVVFSLIQLLLGDRAQVLKFFRILRAFRPLRMVTRNEGLKIAVESLLMSLNEMVRALMITFLFFLIFAIVFVSFLKGKLYKCSDAVGETQHFDNIHECANFGGFWEPFMFTYDSVPQALVTLFHKAITVGWAELMYFGVKADDIGGSVSSNEKLHYENAAFSVIFMMFCSLFILNIFIGIVISAFNREEERISKRSLLTPFQTQWVRLLAKMMKIRPLKKIQTDSELRLGLIGLFKGKAFETFILTLVTTNTLVLCLKWYNMPKEFAKVVESIDFFFAGIFIVEALMKIVVFRSHYFQSSWNKLDLISALLGLADMILVFTVTGDPPIWMRVIKSLRIIRMFRLIKRIYSIKVLLNSTLGSAQAIINVGGLMVLCLIIYSILGVNMFATIKVSSPYLDQDIVNFQTFGNAFLVLFRASTGENWHYILHGVSRKREINYQCSSTFNYEDYQIEGEPNMCGNSYLASIYFISFIIFVNLVLLNLFIAIVLQAYDESSQNQQDVLSEKNLKHFQTVWLQFDPLGKGFIHKDKLVDFLLRLGDPLGLDQESFQGYDLPHSYKKSLELSLYNDIMEIQFYNLLERLARKAIIDDLLCKEIEKEQEKQNNLEHEKLDQIMAKFQEYSKQIETLEENKFQIHVVTQVQKVKNKYQGVGMFEIVTWKEQQSLIKLVRACKARYDRLHGRNRSTLNQQKNKEKSQGIKVENAEIEREESSSSSSSEISSEPELPSEELQITSDSEEMEEEGEEEHKIIDEQEEEEEKEERGEVTTRSDVSERRNIRKLYTKGSILNTISPAFNDPTSRTMLVPPSQIKPNMDDQERDYEIIAGRIEEEESKNQQLVDDDRTEAPRLSEYGETIDPEKNEKIDFQSERDILYKQDLMEEQMLSEQEELYILPDIIELIQRQASEFVNYLLNQAYQQVERREIKYLQEEEEEDKEVEANLDQIEIEEEKEEGQDIEIEIKDIFADLEEYAEDLGGIQELEKVLSSDLEEQRRQESRLLKEVNKINKARKEEVFSPKKQGLSGDFPTKEPEKEFRELYRPEDDQF